MKKSILFFVLIFLSASFNSYGKRIAYWSFDDSTAKDNSGSGYHGTMVNNPVPVIGVHGKGTAMSFIGKEYYVPVSGNKSIIGSYIDLPNVNLGMYNSYTISLWVLDSSMSSFGGESYIILGDQTTAWDGIGRYQESAYNSTYYLFSSSGSVVYAGLNRYIYELSNLKKWVHYALVYNSGVLKTYINGTFAYTQSGCTNPSIKGRSALAGTYWTYNGEYRQSARFTGALDEVMIFDNALSDKEILDLVTPLTPPTSPCLDITKNSFTLVGNTKISNDTVRLSESKSYVSGGAWINYPVNTNDSLTIKFKFKFKNGSNSNSDDRTHPGADGIALVLKKNNDLKIGGSGDSIGYAGLDTCLAIEFDSYINLFEERFDNHVAFNYSTNNPISSNHANDNTVKNLGDYFVADGRTYFSKVVYSPQSSLINVYLGESENNMQKYLSIPNAKNIVNSLFSSNTAYIGFTSGTGDAYEETYLYDVVVCSSNGSTLNVEDSQPLIFDNKDFVLRYDYKSGYLKVSSLLNPNYKITIYNILGYQEAEYNVNGLESEIDISNLPKGVKLIKICSQGKCFTKSIIVQ